MKKQLISTLIATTLMVSAMAPAVQAAPAEPTLNNTQQDSYTVGQDEQLIGMGSGAAVGAVIGGPVGVVIGAMVGGIVGTAVGQDEYIKAQGEEMVELAARNTELERISQRYSQAQIEIARLQQEAAQQQMPENNIEQRKLDLALEMNVHFRTGSASIEQHFQSQLDELAELMKQAPDVKWELSGYADRRGDSLKNYNLSHRRVEAVREYLEQRGVNGDQIFASAYGDQEPLKPEQSFEGDFFDRRVTLRSSQEQVRTANAN